MTQEIPSPGAPPLGRARLDWRDGVPCSADFGDIYFSPKGGLDEARHVFLDGIGAPEVWQGRPRFTVGELGFGTGLNVLALWDSWRRTAPADARLHVVSVEGFPLEPDGLADAHAGFPELGPLAAELRAAYPRRVPGFHRLRLDGGRVVLTLLFGPVGDMLEKLTARIDAWFLDGFAPRRNPEMWTDGVFREVARLSAPGARVATFSAAGAVRRGLAAAGFAMAKRPGFAGKLECLAGRFDAAPMNDGGAPWYAAPAPLGPGATIAVIGGGIAGRAAARALSGEGFHPVLFDAGDAAAQPERVLMSPRLAGPDDVYGRFMAQAFLQAEGQGGLPPASGALHLPAAAEVPRLQDFAARLGWDGGLAQVVDATAASDLAGIKSSRGGMWYPAARFAGPATVLVSEMRTARVTGLSLADPGWRVGFDDGGTETFDAVVLAAGPWSGALVPGGIPGLRANRGQLCHLPVTAASARLRLPVSFGGHITPLTGAGGGAMHVLGSSYRRWDLVGQGGNWRGLDASDMTSALDGLAEVFPDLAETWRKAPLKGWAGLRATTADHLPFVGPLADVAGYEAAYADLHHGRRGNWPAAPYQHNAFVLSGLGSRGYQTAFLAAEILASVMAGAPSPVDREVAAALHPGRMLIRHLRRPPEKRGREI
ncbi:FAD-dependent 5-carboxymethylaminomethyl-2-thiouridine(34) oxidoreductase MnmC [bacterium SCSIO 12827]|nr:FAD-dependent 5-carboxymethylaminomethyl-2-thiouridine(34) oxidoreductase MnmC [bacterium SCSIO 12827]